MNFKRTLSAFALTIGLATSAAAEKWDMPMAYSATSFHSQTGAQFASCVTTGAGGMKVEEPGDPLRADLQDIGKTITAEWLEAAGAEGQAIVDAFKAAR